MTYREMMKTTAQVLGRKRPMIPVPFVSPALSELWVSLVTGNSRSLVRPLIESLRHPMVVKDAWLQEEMGFPGRPFRRRSRIPSTGRAGGNVRSRARSNACRFRKVGASWLGRAYVDWLGRLVPGAARRGDERRRDDDRSSRAAARAADPPPSTRSRDLAPLVLDVVGGLLAAESAERRGATRVPQHAGWRRRLRRARRTTSARYPGGSTGLDAGAAARRGDGGASAVGCDAPRLREHSARREGRADRRRQRRGRGPKSTSTSTDSSRRSASRRST